MTYTEFLTEQDNKATSQLQMGIKVEAEHKDLYEYFKSFCEKHDLKMPLTEDQFFGYVAKSHIKEIPDYYNRLKAMEDAAK